MKKRVSEKFWFPWWPDKWIFGSIRIEFTPIERGIWVDLLSLASKDDGHIRANEETPYPLQQLAGMLIIPENELDDAIKKFIKHEKLTQFKSGTLYVTKWDKYQFTDRHKRRFDVPEDEMSPETDSKSTEEDEVDEVEDTIVKNSIEQIKLKERKEEKAILKEFKQVKNFPRDEKKIIAYIRKLKTEFPTVDVLRVAKEFYPYSLKNPLTKKSNPFARIRRFFINQIKFDKERDRELNVGQTRKEDAKTGLPSKEWQRVAEYLYKNGKEEKEVVRFSVISDKHYPAIQDEWEKSEKKPEEYVRMILAAEMEATKGEDRIDYEKVPELKLEKVVPKEKELVDPPDRGSGRLRVAGDSGFQQRHLDNFFAKFWDEHSEGRDKTETQAFYMKLVRSGKYKPQDLFEKPELVGRVEEGK